MKSADIQINTEIKNEEQKLEMKISVSDFNISEVELYGDEDLDVKTITYIEKQIRNSYEYRSYISYLKDELDLTKCSLLPNIDTKSVDVSLEFHHYPFTLYDITETVAKSMLDAAGDEETISSFDVAEKVLGEHYSNKVGLVPLTETLHEMAHNGAIFIPNDKINGNYKAFIAEYSRYITPEKIEKIHAMEIYTNSDDAKNFNKNKLQKRIVNYDVNYNRKQEGGNNETQD